MRRIPQLKLLMTPFPYSVGIDATETEALELMHEHKVHHLPVTDGHELVGVITERDIRNLEAGRSGGSDSTVATVRDMYIHDAYIVDINEYLDNVLLQMAERHIGSVLVTRKGRLAGVFTTTDACRGFGEYLRERFPHGGDDDAA
ncbi:MAG: CBS domain-containing protein [Thiohalobacterales bacterium]|nr:CBS domain-containing protein [Thiohalobacterales bacterium]